MQKNASVGDIYRQIAKVRLLERNDLDEKHVEKIIASSDFLDLENIARIEKAIIHAIINLKCVAKEHDLVVPPGYIDRVLHGTMTEDHRLMTAGGSNQNIQSQDVLDEVYQELVAFAVCGIHDGLIESSRDDFFKEEATKEGDISRYMPLPLVSEAELERCFTLVSPILLDLGLDLRWGIVIGFYDEYRNNYLSNMGIKCEADLANWIKKGNEFYYPLPYKVSQRLKDDRILVEKITLAIFGRNGVTLGSRR